MGELKQDKKRDIKIYVLIGIFILVAGIALLLSKGILTHNKVNLTTKYGSGYYTQDEIYLKLNANATTGYNWEINYDDKLLNVDSQYTVPDTPGLVGAPGEQEIIIKPNTENSDCVFNAMYCRSWEDSCISSIFLDIKIENNKFTNCELLEK